MEVSQSATPVMGGWVNHRTRWQPPSADLMKINFDGAVFLVLTQQALVWLLETTRVRLLLLAPNNCLKPTMAMKLRLWQQLRQCLLR